MPTTSPQRLGSDSRPFFVVGCPRSGTTLVRLMLDKHPHLAVPPETHFVVQGSGPHEPVDAALERILAHSRFPDLNLAADRVRDEVARQRPGNYPDLVRCLYGLFARDRGKQRWGDKTPHYVNHVPRLLELFPDAQFVHVIRDGREVAASVYAQGWADSVSAAAAFWHRTVADGRAWLWLGPGRYHELRLASLISSPEETLVELCRFLGEPYSPQMLEYHLDARHRLPSRAHAFQSHTALPPTSGLRDWTLGLSGGEQIAIEAICHGQLKHLELPTAKPPLRGYVFAAIQLLHTRWRELRRPQSPPRPLDPALTAEPQRASGRRVARSRARRRRIDAVLNG